MRAECRTLPGQDRRRKSQLQRRSQVVALTYADGNRIASVPFLLVPFHFPFLGWQQTSHFAFDIDSRFLSQTELTGEVEDIVDAEIIGERVVIRVARHYERLVQIHDTVTTGLPVAEAVGATGQAEVSGID